MKSLHIQSDNNKLYSVIHSPSEKNKTLRKHAVVICSPITHEHAASYWAVRQLANRLSKLGFNVVRFDYFASGNSAGESQQTSLQTCVQNIIDVGQYLLENTDCEKLSYIGLRLGAILASMSSVKQPPDQLILWEPVISGDNFIAQTKRMHKNYLDKMNRSEPHQHDLGQEYLGFLYSNHLLKELKQAHLDKITIPADLPISILTCSDDIEQKQFIDKLKITRPDIQHEIATKGTINWQDINILESSFLPGQSINQICNFLKTAT